MNALAARLTDREIQVMQGLINGVDLKEIAEVLRITYYDSRAIASRMYGKLGAENAAHACYLWGLNERPEKPLP